MWLNLSSFVVTDLKGMGMKALWDAVQSISPWLYVPIVGGISGVVSAALQPFFGWRFEHEKLKYANRKEFIAAVRSEVVKLSHEDFLASEVFRRLKPHLSERTMSRLKDSNTVIMVETGPHGSARIESYAESVYQDIAALEQKWHLI